MKRLYHIVLLLLILGMSLSACATKCGVPPKDAQGNPTVIQYPGK